jgi:hypothetical protein
MSRSSLRKPDLAILDAVETFGVIQAAGNAEASVVRDTELIGRVSTPASSPTRDNKVRVAASSFDQGGSSPSQNMRCLYMRYMSM